MSRGQSTKQKHELDVFRGFVHASQLPIIPDSISNRREPEPDMLCSLAGEDHYFELSEVLWESRDQPGCTLAKGHHDSETAARRKSRLLSEGKVEKAGGIQTAGRLPFPPLLSLKQSLERKRSKHYELRYCSCSLLLYYERQSPVEPYDLLFECKGTLLRLLDGSVFDVVWLYYHEKSYSLVLGTPGYGAVAAEGSVPLSAFANPEASRAIIGKLRVRAGNVEMAFDARYPTAHPLTSLTSSDR